MSSEDELRKQRARQRVQARQSRGRAQADEHRSARAARGRAHEERMSAAQPSKTARTPRQLHEERLRSREVEPRSTSRRSTTTKRNINSYADRRRAANRQADPARDERAVERGSSRGRNDSRASQPRMRTARTERQGDQGNRRSAQRQAPAPRRRNDRALQEGRSTDALPARVLGTVLGALTSAASAIAGLVSRLVNRFGLVKLIVGIVVIIVAIVFLSSIPKGCIASNNATTTMTISASSSASSESSDSSESTTAQQTGKPDDGAQIDEAALVNLMGSDDAAAFIQAANTDADVHWIAAHYDQYEVDGYTVQAKLFKLATNEPAARHFVLYWPDKYPQSAGEPLTSSENVITASTGQSVPRYYQWDERWGYTEYSSTTFAVTGCCPTALSMVYTGLTGNTDKTPYDMGVIAVNDGYSTTYNGTDASFLPGEAARLGLYCTEVGVSSSELRSALQQDMVAIINVGEGDFTTSGHYIVAVGLDASGNLIINDPYSEVRSNKTWDIDTVVSQTKVIYAYSAA